MAVGGPSSPGGPGPGGSIGHSSMGRGGTGGGPSGLGSTTSSSRGYGGSRGGSSRSGSSSSTRGPGSTVGAGRRSDALGAFGAVSRGFTSAVSGLSSAFGGLAQGLSDIGQDVGEALGYGYDKAPTFTGSQDLAALNAYTKAQVEKGESKAQRDQVINTAANLAATNPATAPLSAVSKIATSAFSQTLSPTAKQSYDATMEKGLSSLAKTGISKAATGLLGVPGALATTGVDVASLAMMTDREQSRQRSRRSDAVSAFTQGSKNSSSIASSTPSQQPQMTNSLTWEPASYGFGNYGSHIKGLLS